MSDERKQASLSPWPGGDTSIYVGGLVATTAIQGLLYFGVEWLYPGRDHTQFQNTLVALFLPTYASLVGAIKSHANGNAAQEIKDKADVAADKSRAAVMVAAETREEVRKNTDLTAETLTAVKHAADGEKP